MNLNPHIFRMSDIRGVVEHDLQPEVVDLLGKGIGTFMRGKGAKRIALGRDGRLTSERIVSDLKTGLRSCGLEIVDIGLCPTPVLYYSVHFLSLDGGIMVTGSHNPAEFNGVKMAIGGDSISGEMIQEIRCLIDSKEFIKEPAPPSSSMDMLDPYAKWMTSNLTLKNTIQIGLDSGNGVGGLIAPRIFRELGAKVIDIYSDVDGSFPNHHPDPTVEDNLDALKGLVVQNRLDIGIGLDGDADRLGAVDNKGAFIRGDQLMTLFARSILRSRSGATIIGDVKCSDSFYQDVVNNGGRAIRWKTGHALIKNKMREEKALLAGEMSGHYFFADRYFGYDDGIYAAGRLLEIVSELDHDFNTELDDLPRLYNSPEIRVECPDEEKFFIVNHVKKACVSRGYSIDELDGVRILFENGWGLIRASNTQPTLVLRFEADSESNLRSIAAEVEDLLAPWGIGINDDTLIQGLLQ